MTSGLGVAVTGVVLVAAVLHATWNALAHWATDRVTLAMLLGTGTAALSVAVIAVAAPPRAASWPFIAASAALHVVYNGFLLLAYRLGDFSQVYPVARGTSPWIVAIAAAVLIGETPGPGPATGVVVVTVGLVCLVAVGRRPAVAVTENVPAPETALVAANPPVAATGLGRTGGRAAIAAAVATGLAIATYTVIDGIGVRRSGSPIGYAGWLFASHGVLTALTAYAIWRRIGRPSIGRTWPVACACAVLSVLAYTLVLWAQTRGPLAPIAALRESSVVIGAVIGAVVFREGFGRWRILAAVLVVAGIGLLNLP